MFINWKEKSLAKDDINVDIDIDIDIDVDVDVDVDVAGAKGLRKATRPAG